MPKKKQPVDVTDDPRVQKMAQCLVFAINSFKNSIVMSPDMTMTNWHSWFEDALTEAGYKIKKEK